MQTKIDKITQNKQSKLSKPIKIKSKSIIFVLTLISILFLLSGIINIKIFYWLLCFNASDFYSISDYLSSSIDRIIEITILISIYIYFFLKIYFANSKNKTSTEGMNCKTYFMLYSCLVILITIFIYKITYLNKISYTILYFCILLLYTYLIVKINLKKYVKNAKQIYFILTLIGFFLILVSVKVLDDAQNIKEKDYQSPYNVIFKNDIKYENYQYLSSNSNYVFLINTNTLKIIVIPYVDIKYIEQASI